MFSASASRLLFARIGLCLAFVAALVWMPYAQQPEGAPQSNFTGTVNPLKGEGRISYYVFTPGSRTKWHSHEGGQLLLAEEGIGRTQVRGEPVQEIRPGQAVWSPRGATHWHGSAPGQSAKLYQISRGETTWLEEVSEKDYLSAPKR
jgi:quercetin dioxygenase-like cupin family protein